MKTFLLPLALLITIAQAQLLLGAMALIEFTIEILEAEAVIATVDVSVDAALVGAESSEVAAVEGTVTNIGTTIVRTGERAVRANGVASLSGFGRVATEGVGTTEGTFTFAQPSFSVGPLRGATANPRISFTFNARTEGIRNGRFSRINFSEPTVSNIRTSNPGGAGTIVRMRGHPITQFLSSR